MLGDKDKGVLDKADIQKGGDSLGEPVKKKSRWGIKLILVLIIIGGLYYLFTHSKELIIEPVNRFFGGLLS